VSNKKKGERMIPISSHALMLDELPDRGATIIHAKVGIGRPAGAGI
jgi:hypothetical protein